ncbi:MAG: dockerin type I repeat-containing protein [Clostridiales bacterium]|nr:dockerin type I repeat-containing protein [Clostridiales bacterium]
MIIIYLSFSYEAVLNLSVNEETASNKIGNYSYISSLVCSSTTSGIVLDGASKSMRIHSSITAKQNCIVTIATTVPSGKEIAFAEKNNNGTYTSLAYYDGELFYGNVETVFNLSEGQTVYIMGQTTNPYIYAIDATSLGDANGEHVIDLIDAIRIMQYTDSLTTLTDTEFAAADINGDKIVDREDAAFVLKQLLSTAD